jgi:hypothetical protein
MRQKHSTPRSLSEKVIKDIRRTTRRQYSAEDKIRIVLDGLRGKASIAGCAGARASRKACTALGPKSFSKPESGVWPAIRSGQFNLVWSSM